MSSVVEPTENQRRILKLIYSEFQRTGRRPTYQWIDKLADNAGLSLRRHVSSMPPRLMTPDPTWEGQYYWRKEDDLLVTVQGLLYCGDEARADLDLLARVLRYFADRERAFTPADAHVVEDIVIRSDEVKQELGLDELGVAKVYVLLQQFESQMRFGSGGAETTWEWTLEGELIRKYREINDGVTYLQARGDLPEPEPTTVVGRAKWIAERLWLKFRGFVARTRQRMPERLAALLRHPLVVGVVVAVVSTLLTLHFH